MVLSCSIWGKEKKKQTKNIDIQVVLQILNAKFSLKKKKEFQV